MGSNVDDVVNLIYTFRWEESRIGGRKEPARPFPKGPTRDEEGDHGRIDEAVTSYSEGTLGLSADVVCRAPSSMISLIRPTSAFPRSTSSGLPL